MAGVPEARKGSGGSGRPEALPGRSSGLALRLAGLAVLFTLLLGAAAAGSGIVVRDAWVRAAGGAAAGGTAAGGDSAAGAARLQAGADGTGHRHAPAAWSGAWAVYLTLENRTERPDRLVRVSTPVAAAAELHTTRRDGEVVRMRPVEAMEVPAGGTLIMAPGGDHVMLLGLERPLEPGTKVPLTLEFASGARITLDVPVRER